MSVVFGNVCGWDKPSAKVLWDSNKFENMPWNNFDLSWGGADMNSDGQCIAFHHNRNNVNAKFAAVRHLWYDGVWDVDVIHRSLYQSIFHSQISGYGLFKDNVLNLRKESKKLVDLWLLVSLSNKHCWWLPWWIASGMNWGYGIAPLVQMLSVFALHWQQ